MIDQPSGTSGSIAGELTSIWTYVAVMVTVSPGSTVVLSADCVTDTSCAATMPTGENTETSTVSATSVASVCLYRFRVIFIGFLWYRCVSCHTIE